MQCGCVRITRRNDDRAGASGCELVPIFRIGEKGNGAGPCIVEGSDAMDQNIARADQLRVGALCKHSQGNPGTFVTWIHAR